MIKLMESPFLYKIKLKIGDLDLSSNITGINIINSLNILFPLFKLNILINKSDIVKEKIFGNKDIKLTIVFKEYKYDYTLIILDHMFNSENISSGVIGSDLCKCELKCALKDDFEIINKNYANIFHQKTLNEIITIMATDLKLKLILNPSGLNTNVIDQVVMSSRNPIQQILYLDKYFGIYGAPLSVVLFNKKLLINNLNTSIKSKPILKFNRFVYDSDKKLSSYDKSVIKKCNDDENCFVFYNPLQYNNNGAKKIGILGEKLKVIVKPSDTLSYTINLDIHDIFKENSLISGLKKTYFNHVWDNSIMYYTDETGYEKTEQFAKTYFSKKISNLFQIKFEISDYILLEHLTTIGLPFMLKSWDENEMELNGNYILQSISLDLMNVNGEWKQHALIYGMRTSYITGQF